jgi:hypothetical protein
MPELSLHHIDQISKDISKQEIIFSHLLEDLIDHVCCDVEYEMQKGIDFSEAYRNVKKKMGSGRLKEIQKETLYQVDTKYRKMKNTMKFSGVAGTILLGIAAAFKIQHWPGSAVMMTLGALTLAFVFMPSALGVLWKETHNRKRILLFVSVFMAGMFFILGTLFKVQHWPFAGILLSIAAVSGILFFVPTLTLSMIQDQENKSKRPVYMLGALGIIFYAIGLFFKIQHWPLATIMMTLGVIVLSFIAFPWFTYITWKEDNHVSPRFIFIIIGFLVIIVPGVLINLNLQNSYDAGYYPHVEQQQIMYNTLYANNLAVLNQYQDSAGYKSMEQLHSRTKETLAYIGNIQTQMIAESEGKPGVPALSPSQILQTETGPQIQYNLLSNAFNPGPVFNFLMPGSKTREELISIVNEYRSYLSGLNSGNDIEKIKNLIDASVFLPFHTENGSEVSLISGLHALQMLKNSILTVESIELRSFAKK